MLSRLKEKFDKILFGLASALHSAGLSPNLLTVLGLIFAILASLAYYYKSLSIALISLLLSGFIDMMDGVLARAYGGATKFGAFLDSFSDRLGELVIYSGILLSGLASPAFSLAALASSFLVSYTRAKGEAEGVTMQVGVGERAERLIILAVATLVGQIEVGIILVAVLASFTVAQRIAHLYQRLR